MIEVGQPAPAFSVIDENGRVVTEKDLLGKWTVLYAYPKDDTPGCTTEACEFTASIEDFANLGAVVLGVSPDSPDSHRRFIAKKKLKVRLLSDPDHRMLEAYGGWGNKVLYGKTSVGVIRSTVIVDPKGVVAHRWAKVSAAGHAEFVRQRLEEVRSAAEAARPPKKKPSTAPAKRK